jgi:hypothetical protein
MQKRLNKKIETYTTSFKDSIREKTSQIWTEPPDEKMKLFLHYVYDYDRLTLIEQDFQKRQRVKNHVPIFNRCCAKRVNFEYCGTHLKGTPHGIVDTQNEVKNTTHQIEVYAQDIQGIIYYIDKNFNVYQAEDIISNKINPQIIAKYVKEDDKFSIPEFNI